MVENVYRSRDNKWLGGVAGGLAERLEWPSLLVRALFVVFGLFFHVASVAAYLALWLTLPEGPMIGVNQPPIIEEEVVENISDATPEV